MSWEAQFGDVKSDCHDAAVTADRKEGVTFGICTASGCGKPIVRANPSTGFHEYLGGRDIHTIETLELVERK